MRVAGVEAAGPKTDERPLGTPVDLASKPATAEPTSAAGHEPPASPSGQTVDTFSTKELPRHARSATVALSLERVAKQVGIIGQAQINRVQRTLRTLTAADKARFDSVIAAAETDIELTYLHKALAAGRSVTEIEKFAQDIRGWPTARMVHVLSLADNAPVIAPYLPNAVKQQYANTCTPTTAQALRAEYDPMYALAVRQANVDVNYANPDVPDGVNRPLAQEQASLLRDPGHGRAVPRSDFGSGRGPTYAAAAAIVNTMSAFTGFRYALPEPPVPMGQRLALLAAQLEQGIATPISFSKGVMISIMGDEKEVWAHLVLAKRVFGSGPTQRFLIHDPATGRTVFITRAEFENGTFELAGYNRLAAVAVATPIDDSRSERARANSLTAASHDRE